MTAKPFVYMTRHVKSGKVQRRETVAKVLDDIEREHETRRQEQVHTLADGLCVPRHPRLVRMLRKARRRLRRRPR